MSTAKLLLSLCASAVLFTLPAAAADKVVVYTAAKSAMVDAIAPLFEKASGIKVEVVKGGSGDILKRLRAEAGNPGADVVWSVGGEQLEDNKDLLATYKPLEDAAIMASYKVSPEWIPANGIMAVLAVNTAQLKPADYPKTWKDLADPKWKGKVSSAKAASSGSAFQQMATVIEIYGPEQGWKIYGDMMKNFVMSESSGNVPRLVNDGEAQVGLTLEDNALDFVRGGGKVAIVYPEDGTSSLADGIALIKGAKNPEPAKKFIDFMLSKEVQEVTFKEFGRRPVRADVPTPGAKPTAEIKIINYDIPKIAKARAEWVKKWRDLSNAL